MSYWKDNSKPSLLIYQSPQCALEFTATCSIVHSLTFLFIDFTAVLQCTLRNISSVQQQPALVGPEGKPMTVGRLLQNLPTYDQIADKSSHRVSKSISTLLQHLLPLQHRKCYIKHSLCLQTFKPTIKESFNQFAKEGSYAI